MAMVAAASMSCVYNLAACKYDLSACDERYKAVSYCSEHKATSREFACAPTAHLHNIRGCGVPLGIALERGCWRWRWRSLGLAKGSLRPGFYCVRM